LKLVSKDYSGIGIDYAQRVVSGEIDACKLVKQACQRQLDDLEGAPARGWTFSTDCANRVCRFIEKLPHIKGRWKTRNLDLEPWQCFLLTTLFGWVDEEGFRRFRKAYTEVPRKNGKSSLAAGIALYMLCADGEPGCEAYSAAVTRDQARIVWETAQQMVKAEPEMQSYYGVEPLAHSIVVVSSASCFQPLSRDADSLEGKNPHVAIVDELHAHKTREVFDVLNLAMGSRRQSLLFAITTAGSDKLGVCYEQRQYVEQILNGRHVDDRYWGIIYTLDPADDWTREASARKANPNYGVSVMPDDMTTLCQQAQRSAESQSAFLNKRLNLWTSVGTAYFNMLAWQNLCCNTALKIEDFYEKRCIMALDLASKDDIAVSLKLFHENGKRYLFAKYYLPSSAIERGNNPNYDVYAGWARAFPDKFILTEGNVIDFEFIERDLLEDRAKFDVREVAFDPFNATELSTRMLKEGLPMIEVGATVRNFSEPMKQLAALIVSGGVQHDGDPVLGWMIGNVYAKVDAHDNVYPRKTRNENKIDGAVAAIMALGRNIVGGGENFVSIYENRGLIFM